MQRQRNRSDLNIGIDENEFVTLLVISNLSEPLLGHDLKNIYKPLLHQIQIKSEHEWMTKYSYIDHQISTSLIGQYQLEDGLSMVIGITKRIPIRIYDAKT